MPPSLMRSSECSTVSKKRASFVRRPARHSISRIAGCGNFGAPRRPPLTESNILPICIAAAVSSFRPIVTLPAGRALEPRKERGTILFDSVRLLTEQPRNLAQHVDKGRAPKTRLLGKICTAPHGLGLRREKHCQRPTALLTLVVYGVHIDLVDRELVFDVKLV